MSAEVDHYGSQYGHFVSDLYASIRSETYGEDIGQNGWLTAAEQNLFIDWLKLSNANELLLDVACGSGGPTMRIVERSGCQAIGIDIHPKAISTARVSAQERGLSDRVTFERVDGGRGLAYENGTFDAVICVDAINHIPDRAGVLAEWHRLLKPGGRLVFTDPIVITGPLTNKEIATRGSIGFFLFVPEQLDDRLLEEAGFSITNRENRTENMATMAARWAEARSRHENELRRIEGDSNYDGQQAFFGVCASLAAEARLSRLAYHAVKT